MLEVFKIVADIFSKQRQLSRQMSESFAELSPYDGKAKAKASDTISPKTLQSIGYSGEDKKDALDVSDSEEELACESVTYVWDWSFWD
jgi:hypothetical protein